MTSKVVYLATPQKVGKFFGVEIDQLLTNEEIFCLSGLVYEKRKKDWLAGRLATKSFVKSYLSQEHKIDSDISKICIYNGEAGEPYWKFRDYPDHYLASKLCVSISHTSGYAVSTGEDTASIGIDIEPIRNISSNLLSYFLNNDEIKVIKRYFDNLNEGATLYWTLKEATGKALRVGLRIPLKSININLSDKASKRHFTISVKRNKSQRDVLLGAYTRFEKFLISVVSTAQNQNLDLSIRVI